ncbi:unnamed protein product [Ilex paraguariensis]|uniref:ENTH domain-containing protein n=1 Tax=Ilex paraguariensis TaxID=185542 RepID=A0ABC8RDI2_9AQUA
MSILGSNSNGADMGTPFFHEFKKQASFFLKEKIKTARLVLTDVTPAQLLTEEATNGNPGGPDARTLKMISRAAFEVDDYWRIVEILHKRLLRFDRKNWRLSYKALIVVEHLLTHGPESVAEEFQSDKDVIGEMGSFQHIDERGFNWGLNVRKKSERILKLLEKGTLLKEERNRARKLTRGIEGFGSFCQRTTSGQGILKDSSLKTYGRCNSQFNNHGNQEDQFSYSSNENQTQTWPERSQQIHDEKVNSLFSKKVENLNFCDSFSSQQKVESFSSATSLKENMAPSKEIFNGHLHEWSCTGESKPLLNAEKDGPRIGNSEEDHPFNDAENPSSVSLLSSTDQILQAC